MTLNVNKVTKKRAKSQKKRATNGRFSQNTRFNGHARFKTGNFYTLVELVGGGSATPSSLSTTIFVALLIMNFPKGGEFQQHVDPGLHPQGLQLQVDGFRLAICCDCVNVFS